MAERLTKDEISWLSLVMHHYSDYIGGDDRPDHGWARLKEAREASQETKQKIYQIAGKLWRMSRDG
jgi:alpha-amylase/alpha-mannosidase (GH57 family)